MKKIVVISSVVAMLVSLCGCGVTNTEIKETTKTPVTLNVTTTWSGTDESSVAYRNCLDNYMQESGNIINDFSGGANEIFKERVQMDFEVGGEPDVLFYFNGSDANAFIKAGKVVSIDTIREEYPDFASNLDDSTFVASEVDGKVYSLPIYGYWEAMYVNKKVCEAAGVDIPDKDTDWDEFMEICGKIRDAGYTPIAASLAKEPHYWFEFAIYNQLTPNTHTQIPTSLTSKSGKAWVDGLTDLKDMYTNGIFSEDTINTSAEESFQSFLDGEAAFFVDGSWKIGTIVSSAENLEDFTVTFVPGKGGRKSTDIIGGFSSGWYISTSAWEDPEKRQAAVEFVTYMTGNEVVSELATIGVSATTLKDGADYDDAAFNSLQKDAAIMLGDITSISPAVQDGLSVTSRAPMFDGMPNIVTGRVSVEEAIESFLVLREAETSAIVE